MFHSVSGGGAVRWASLQGHADAAQAAQYNKTGEKGSGEPLTRKVGGLLTPERKAKVAA